MIIANRLADGRVVFLDAEDSWVAAIEEGVLLEEAQGPTKLATAKAHEARCLVVEPALIEVEEREGRRRPVAIREAIRAFGPSVRTELQAGPERR
jgi:hypothetical protein